MQIPKAVQAILSIISYVIDILVLLDFLGFVRTPIFHGAEILTTYSQYPILLALVVFGLLTFWLGHQFAVWRDSRLFQKPIRKVTAYLFFPKNTKRDNLTPEFHRNNFLHRVIVNFKTIPPVAYNLTPDSDGWKLIETYGRSIWIPEIDANPKEPVTQFLENWCKQKNYTLMPNLPDNYALLAKGPLNPDEPLDPRFKHLEYVGFFPWYSYLLPKRGIPHRRILMDKSTKKAYKMTTRQWIRACNGVINGDTKIANPRRHHAQEWAREHGFEYCDCFDVDIFPEV